MILMKSAKESALISSDALAIERGFGVFFM